MKYYCFIFLIFLFSILHKNGNSQITKTVGGVGANYATLKAAFDAVNAGTISGIITLQITGSTTEAASAKLNASGSGSANYSLITIYPTSSGYSISGNFNSDLIKFDGADNVVIDGRVNQLGDANLIINNANTANVATTIKFTNSAENNTIKYCYLKASVPYSNCGVIVFATSSAGNGNDNNLIDNNYISSDVSGRLYNAIYSQGSVGYENSENIISNNNIYDFLSSTTSSRGINILSNSNNWIVRDNSFYETTTITPSTNHNYFLISIGTSTSHLISGNYLGGSQPHCGGSPMTINSSFSHYFYAMYISGGLSTPVTVENNFIQNIDYTSTSSNLWDGIYLASRKITLTGNTIGGSTGNNSIVITSPNASASTTISGGVVTAINIIGGGSGFTTAPLITFSTAGSTTPATATATITDGVVTGYTITNGGEGYTSAPSVLFNGATYSTAHGIRQVSTDIVTISNNNIGAITTVSSNYYSHCFESIVISGAAPSITINNNLIGSLTTPNSIQAISLATNSLTKQDLRGIFVNSSVTTTTITNNTVANLTNSYMGGSVSKLDGICISGGSNTIQNNTIRDLSTGTSSITIKGIQQTVNTSGTSQTVTGNTIYNLSNTNASNLVSVTGIQYLGSINGVNNVSGNFIHSISMASTNIASEIHGIEIGAGVTTCANNIINLGEGVTTGYKIYGIYDNSNSVAENNNNIYFNTVYIGGTISAGTTQSTAALWNVNNTSTRNYQNNILFNARSGGATGKHYAIRLAGILNLTTNYNNYFANGANGVLGYSVADRATLLAFQTATTKDANSLNINPLFAVAGGTSALNYYTSAVIPGISIGSITTDYAGLTRGSTPKIGALEPNDYTWQGAINTDFATAGNWTCGAVPPNGADITFAISPNNHCILDQNRTVGSITNAQSTYNLVINGKQITINGNLNFTNNAKIDATANSSIILFNGLLAQTIPTGSFVSNTIDALNNNNINGLSLNGDLIVTQTLTLTNGDFSIGSNTLTLNGAINKITGNLIGGISSNLIFGGVSANTNLSTIALNNLTLNRSNGISLTGSVDITGTLSLTSGTLTVGANILTISGNSPIRTSGNIDASNTASTLIFANTNAITLPSSIFTGAVNNLTISGTGGITGNDDFSINGILNLQSVNPSATKGILDMWNGFVYKTITMGANATTVGLGDVTGIIKRTTINPGVVYSFGNEFTTAYFNNIGTLPTEISAKIIIGLVPSWRSGAIAREIEIIQTGGSGTKAAFSCHYLDSELNGNNEERLVLWVGLASNVEYGRSAYNTTNNWVALSNINVAFFSSTWSATKNITLDEFSDVTTLTWNGSLSNSWTSIENWTPNAGPSSNKNIIIPNASTTPIDPVLPCATEIKTLTIENGGILNSIETAQLTINGSSGAWSNTGGIFNPNTSNVIFTNDNATISGTTSFYDLTINTDKILWMESGTIMRIAGTITNNGIWRTVIGGSTTIDYNGGNQTIVIPNSTTNRYSTLILSGSGTKTMPSTALSIIENLTISGTASVTAKAAISIGGNLSIEDGATFITGNYNHSISGNFINNGIFIATTGNTITMNGALAAQYIQGTAAITSFYNLTINNTFELGRLTITLPATVSNILTLSNKNIFTYSEYPFTLLGGSTVNPEGGSASSFVDGPISKEGTTAFIFPTGNNSRWSRLGIGAPTSSTKFTAQYFETQNAIPSTMAILPLPVLENISLKEYWHLNRTSGTGNTTITLYWEDAAWSGISDCENLRIAHLSEIDSTWENNNDLTSTTGMCDGISSGSISTIDNVTSFSPFTFGSKLAIVNPLPIELLSFTANYSNKNIILNWSTLSETNNAYFTLEKSINANVFNSIASIQGMGTSNIKNDYLFTDTNPYKGINYYRLRQTDFDGKNTTSKIISIDVSNLTSSKLIFDIYPNPIYNTENPNIRISNFESDKEILVVVVNILGEELFSKVIITDYSGNSVTALDLQNKLPAGMYLIIGTSLNQTFNKHLIIK